jgi:hypothetical protein
MILNKTKLRKIDLTNLVQPTSIKLRDGYVVEYKSYLETYHMREADAKYFEDKRKREERALVLDIDNEILNKINEIKRKSISDRIIKLSNKIAASSIYGTYGKNKT